jgi:putative PIN family toxin of toxin-antitoxin system
MSDSLPRNVVVDTNVHFSAWRTRNHDSPPKEVIVRGVRKHFHIAVSPLLLAEIYEKMTEVLKISEELAGRYISLLRKAGRLYSDVDNEIVWCADPDDAFLFVLAHHCEAWCIVAYDSLFFEPHRRRTTVDFTCFRPVDFLRSLRALRGESHDRRSAFEGSVAAFTERDGPPSEPR